MDNLAYDTSSDDGRHSRESVQLEEMPDDQDKKEGIRYDESVIADTSKPPKQKLHTSVALGAVPIERLQTATEDVKARQLSEPKPESNEVSYPRQRTQIKDLSEDVKDGDTDRPEDKEDYSLLSFIPNYEKFKDLYQDFRMTPWPSYIIISALFVLYVAYFIAVLVTNSAIENDQYWCNGDGLLIIITLFGALILVYYQVLKKYFGKKIRAAFTPIQMKLEELFEKRVVRYVVYAAILLAVAIFLIVDTKDNRARLQSVIGVFVLLGLGFIFSYAPRKVNWRQVSWGMGLQFILGLIILRWPTGKEIFSCAGNKISTLLGFTSEGNKFVFGELAGSDSSPAVFAFSVLPVILFFSFIIQILYYYGVMQVVVIKVGWLLQVTVGTTACESVNAAANVFLGMTEAPLMIKPFIPDMTKSELHAVLTGGFATIAGSVMAAYISFGISASHLLSASVMSAPAALAYAKLFYPETEKSKTDVTNIQIVKCKEVNALHAALEGVVGAIPLVANIAANLIAFISAIAFVNAVFNWFCMLINIEEGVCTLENISGYVFLPLAWTMGVEAADCRLVGTLIGTKTVINEFVAYLALGNMIRNGQLSARSQIIATYALCGFSNISSIGVQMGGIGSLAPERRNDIAKVILRAVIAGSAACFLTGCIAGILIDDLHTNADLDSTFNS